MAKEYFHWLKIKRRTSIRKRHDVTTQVRNRIIRSLTWRRIQKKAAASATGQSRNHNKASHIVDKRILVHVSPTIMEQKYIVCSGRADETMQWACKDDWHVSGTQDEHAIASIGYLVVLGTYEFLKFISLFSYLQREFYGVFLILEVAFSEKFRRIFV